MYHEQENGAEDRNNFPRRRRSVEKQHVKPQVTREERLVGGDGGMPAQCAGGTVQH